MKKSDQFLVNQLLFSVLLCRHRKGETALEKYLNLDGLEHLCRKVKTDLAEKQVQLSGRPGQVVGFDAAGCAIPQDIPSPESLMMVPGGGIIEMGAGLGEGPYTFEYEEDGKGGAVSAAEVAYDGVGSGLEAVTVQGAIDTLSEAKADAGRVSNPNLLDNWYLAAPINQRNQPEYRGGPEYWQSVYGIDRWTSAAIVSLTPDGIHCTADSYEPRLIQYIEPYRFLSGQTYTISVLFANKTLLTASGVVDLTAAEYTYYFGVSGDACGISLSSDTEKKVAFTVGGDAGASITPVAVKLELGAVQTLAHKEGAAWVLNDPPPDKALELLKCCRYYYSSMYSGISTRNLHVFQLQEASDVLTVNVSFPVPIRTNPTVTIFSGDGQTANAVSAWAANTTIPNVNVYGRESNTGTLGLGTLAASAALPAGTYSFHVIADANL